MVRTYDPEKANALLDEAGWVLNESTGIREKDGQALSLKYTYDSGDALNKSLATAVKEPAGGGRDQCGDGRPGDDDLVAGRRCRKL